MMYVRSFSRLWPLMLVCLLAGCIEVKDFGAYWNKGYTDACANRAMRAHMDKDEQDAAMRSLRLGDDTFLMIRDHADDKGGELIRYAIDGDDFVTYRLKEEKRTDFLRLFPHSSVILTKETATIPLLNDESAQLLETIAADKGYWLENSREPYNPDHINCIQDHAHEQSRP